MHTTLSTVDTSTNPLLSPNAIFRLDSELNNNPFCLVVNTSDREQLDMIGTLLWNACTDLMISRGHNPEDVLVLGKVRALAFAVLNMAVLPDLLGFSRPLVFIGVSLSNLSQGVSGRSIWPSRRRVFALVYHPISHLMSLSTLTTTTVNHQREIALNILSVAALRLASVQSAHLGLDPAISRTVTTRYFLLRIRLVGYIVGTLFHVSTPELT